MFAIVICLLIILGASVLGWIIPRSDFDKRFFSFTAGTLGLLAGLLLFMPICGCTGGLLPGYSEGDRVGYITKASRKGIVWTTNEVEMQIGTGQMAALQEPQPMSIPDAALFQEAVKRVGDKAKVHYEQWLIMPFWIGKSGYEVKRIEWLTPETEP